MATAPRPPSGSDLDGDPSPAASGGPDRRRVLSAGAAGIFSLTLPPAAAHATGGQDQGGGLTAPTGVTVAPIGYVSDANTGAIRVSWNPVTDATGYSVGWATTSSGNGPYTPIDVGNVTSYDLTGRVGTDTTHYIVVSATDGDTVSLNSTEVTSSPVIATGGTVTTFTGNGTIGDAGINYVVHEFTSVGTTTFVLNRSRDVEYLVVGGGGGGGARVGAGGGAGAMRTGNFEGMTGSTSVTVGAGGNGAIATGASSAVTAGSDGGDSVFGAITADGGGRGASNIVEGSYGHTAGPSAGNTGASGGGGARSTPAGIGGAHGNDGGAGHEAGTVAAGGGGGAGGVGGAASAGTAGAGGSGATSTITGTSRFYAAGGGGSAQNTAAAGDGAGGSDIGGDGAGTPETAVPITAGSGTDATGSGGGGSASNVGANTGGAGGSGVVVVRYALPA